MSEETIAAHADLRAAITSVFKAMGQENPEAWLKDVSEKVNNDIEKAIVEGDIKYQRFLINRYFRNQLGNATVEKNIDTMNARWCLIENDTADRWLHLFNVVAKCIISNSLCGMMAALSIPETTEITA